MSGEKVVIIMGSRKDLDFIEPALEMLKDFDVDYNVRVASGHKTPNKLLDILDQPEGGESIVYITVAGRSNALSGVVDANTNYPVIACPPYSSKFGGADIFSSLRMPSGVCPMVVLDPENAVLSALKILGLVESDISEKISSHKEELREKINRSDEKTNSVK